MTHLVIRGNGGRFDLLDPAGVYGSVPPLLQLLSCHSWTMTNNIERHMSQH